MPSIDTEQLIKEYWETVKDKYPYINYESFEKICKAPFWFFKSQIEKKETPTIHVKYFGKFVVFSQYVYRLIEKNNKRLETNLISQEEWEIRNNNLTDKLREVLENEQKDKNVD